MATHWKNMEGANKDYLGSYSLEEAPNKEVILTVKNVRNAEVVGDRGLADIKIIIDFEENQIGTIKVKPMIMNATNCKTMEKLYSPYIEEWVGKEVLIYVDKVSVGREIKPCLRIKEEKPTYKCSVCGKEMEKKAFIATINKYGISICTKECLEKSGINIEEGEK